MRRFVAASVAALLALALSGCGGGGGEEAAAPTDVPAPGAAAPADPAAVATSETVAPEGPVFLKFPVTDQTPEAITEAIGEGQPLVLFFFDSDQLVTNDVRTQINNVMDDNSGLTELHAYNLGAFATVGPEGTIEVEENALSQDSAGQSTVALARDLGIGLTPFVIVVDSQGYIIFQQSGFIDADLLERQVQRSAE